MARRILNGLLKHEPIQKKWVAPNRSIAVSIVLDCDMFARFEDRCRKDGDTTAGIIERRIEQYIPCRFGYQKYDCPSCGTHIDDTDGKQNFCYNCGRRLK